MKCPECNREYDRASFGRDETYFECEDCTVALQLDSTEQRDVLLAEHGLASLNPRAGSRIANALQEPTTTGTSFLPAYLWIGLLLLLTLGGISIGVNELHGGRVGEGAFVMVFYLVLAVPTIVGVLLRRKFGLYMTYGLLGLILISLPGSLLNSGARGLGQLVGVALTTIVIGAIAIFWIRWFAQNSILFDAGAKRDTGLRDDIYSAHRPSDDVQQAIEPERAQRRSID